MRARGAQATDIAILVVAADDGVMPQTIEALNHAQAADVPIVVAVNKIDIEGADPSKVRGQLTEYGLVAEEYGGDTMFVDVSAKQGWASTTCSRPIVLTADAALDLRANPDQDAQGIAIEGHLDRGRGPVATVWSSAARCGSATPSSPATRTAGSGPCSTRTATGRGGRAVAPVQVLGLTSVPGAGDNFLVVDEDRTARQIAERREARERNAPFGQGPQAGLARGPALLKRQGRRAQPHPQGRRVRFGRGARGRPAQDRRGRRGRRSASSTAASARSPRTTSTWPWPPTRSSSASTSARQSGSASWPSARASRSATTRSSTRRSRRSRRPSRACSSRSSRRSSSARRRSARSSGRPSSATSRARGPLRRDHTQRQGRLVRDGAVVRDDLTIESLRRFKDDVTEVREGYECGIGLGVVQRHQGRRRHRDLRDAREAPRSDAHRERARRRGGDRGLSGRIAFDLLLGDVRSLKQKRSVVRPIVAELRRTYAVAAAEIGYHELHRRAEVGVAVRKRRSRPLRRGAGRLRAAGGRTPRDRAC